MWSCKEYATSLASGELDRAPLGRRLAAAYHWLICRYCRVYSRQLRAIGSGARRLLRRPPEDPGALAEVEERLAELCRSVRPSDSPSSEPDA